MKIAQIILPWIALPPEKYGGTERIVWTLTEELVKRGHEVTLFAAGDCRTSARLSCLFPKSLGLQERVKTTLTTSFDPLAHVAFAFERAGAFDIIHSHAQYLGLPLSRLIKTPTVHTFHRIFQGTADEERLLRQFQDQNFVSISDSQRDLDLHFVGTVYNGIPVEEYPFSPVPGTYLFWTGRMLPKKGVLESMEIARRFGMKLKIAGVVTDGDFFETHINPFIDGAHIEYLGELTQPEMATLYAHAYATLFPISWREPFGLVMAESMACGTPVVAFPAGAVPEILEDGVTGCIVPDVAGAVDALKKVPALNRKHCRKRVKERFSVATMTDGYERVYRSIVGI